MGQPNVVLACESDLDRVTRENGGRNPFFVAPANTDFIDADRAVLVALSSEAEILAVRLNRNEWARLSMIGLEPDTQGVVSMDDVQFLLQVNRTTIRTINNQIAQGDDPGPLFVKVQEPGSTIRVMGVNNNAVSPATMFCRLIGWTVPF